MKKFLLCLLGVLLVGPALAGSLGVAWTNATKDTTGANLPATGPDSLANIRIEYVTCGSIASVVWPATPLSVTVAAPATGTTITGLTSGTQACARAYSLTLSGVASDPSGVAIGPVLGVKPAAPGALIIAVTVATAYKMRQAIDSFTMIAIGSVPLDTPCDPVHSADGYMAVPRSAVKLASRFDTLPLVVFAQCG